jgi:hypothetical protein
MKKIAIALSTGVTFAILMSGVVFAADKLKDVSCDQFLSMDAFNQNAIVYWIDGIETATDSSKKSMSAADIEVGYDLFGNPIAEIVSVCNSDKKASLWDKIKKHFHDKD